MIKRILNQEETMGRIRETRFCFFAGICLLLSAGSGCADGDGPPVPEGGGVKAAACDDTAVPVVYAHGFMEVGDAFANQSMRFAANGYCPDRVHAFDWNTIGNFDQELARFEGYVDRVQEETGADRFNLVGHSMGTRLSRTFLNKPENAARVEHYVGIAGFSSESLPGGVPSMTLSSEDDKIAGTSHIEGGENVLLPGQDHLMVSTSPESFRHMYRFFNGGREPRTLEMEPTAEVRLSGRLLSFAENQPAPGMELNIYSLDAATGLRLTPEPSASFISDVEGAWGPFLAEPGRYYEYEVIDPSGRWKPIHYYREPLPRSCNLVHFRVFPPPESLLGAVFQILLGFNPEGMLLATLNMNRAVVHGRDTLFVDGYEISTPEVADAEMTAIAIFYTDFPFVDAGVVPPYIDLFMNIFIRTFDLAVEIEPPRVVPLSFNGRDLMVRNWPSGTEGVVIGVFE
jgi:pimeloyl-ACP methyl ester carboxylesterase